MRQRHVTNGLLILASLAAAPSSFAHSLNVAVDAYVSSSSPGSHFGSVTTVQVKNTGATLRAFVRFDLSSLSSGAPIDKASLRLWVQNLGTAGTIDIVPVLSAWQESTITNNN